MRVLLDTCVLSEIRRKQGDARVRKEVSALPAESLFLSVLTIGELTKGIELLVAGDHQSTLRNWLLTLEQDYADHILDIDTETARIWGELTATAQARGRTIPVSDGLIAATAVRHGLHVMTRNVADFVATGAMLLDPWQGGG